MAMRPSSNVWWRSTRRLALLNAGRNCQEQSAWHCGSSGRELPSQVNDASCCNGCSKTLDVSALVGVRCYFAWGLAGVCDSDVEKICNRKDATKKAVWNIGFIGRCLAYQLSQNKPMQPLCQSLVIVAAPQVRCSPPPFSGGVWTGLSLFGCLVSAFAEEAPEGSVSGRTGCAGDV